MKVRAEKIGIYFSFQPACREQAEFSCRQTECDLLSVILMAKPLSPPIFRDYLAAADFFHSRSLEIRGEGAC